MPTDILLHLDTSKVILMKKMFTHNTICLNTLNDFYLNPTIANKRTIVLIRAICERMNKQDYYSEDYFEKLKNSLLYMDKSKTKELPWFLK